MFSTKCIRLNKFNTTNINNIFHGILYKNPNVILQLNKITELL